MDNFLHGVVKDDRRKLFRLSAWKDIKKHKANNSQHSSNTSFDSEVNSELRFDEFLEEKGMQTIKQRKF
jgi:hypothetical protein